MARRCKKIAIDRVSSHVNSYMYLKKILIKFYYYFLKQYYLRQKLFKNRFVNISMRRILASKQAFTINLLCI